MSSSSVKLSSNDGSDTPLPWGKDGKLLPRHSPGDFRGGMW